MDNTDNNTRPGSKLDQWRQYCGWWYETYKPLMRELRHVVEPRSNMRLRIYKDLYDRYGEKALARHLRAIVTILDETDRRERERVFGAPTANTSYDTEGEGR